MYGNFYYYSLLLNTLLTSDSFDTDSLSFALNTVLISDSFEFGSLRPAVVVTFTTSKSTVVVKLRIEVVFTSAKAAKIKITPR